MSECAAGRGSCRAHADLRCVRSEARERHQRLSAASRRATGAPQVAPPLFPSGCRSSRRGQLLGKGWRISGRGRARSRRGLTTASPARTRAALRIERLTQPTQVVRHRSVTERGRTAAMSRWRTGGPLGQGRPDRADRRVEPVGAHRRPRVAGPFLGPGDQRRPRPARPPRARAARAGGRRWPAGSPPDRPARRSRPSCRSVSAQAAWASRRAAAPPPDRRRVSRIGGRTRLPGPATDRRRADASVSAGARPGPVGAAAACVAAIAGGEREREQQRPARPSRCRTTASPRAVRHRRRRSGSRRSPGPPGPASRWSPGRRGVGSSPAFVRGRRLGQVRRPRGGRRAGDRAGRGGVERHPAEAREEHLGPRVQVEVGQVCRRRCAGAGAPGEAERDPGRVAGRPDQPGQRRRVLHAEALLGR